MIRPSYEYPSPLDEEEAQRLALAAYALEEHSVSTGAMVLAIVRGHITPEDAFPTVCLTEYAMARLYGGQSSKDVQTTHDILTRHYINRGLAAQPWHLN